MTAKVEVDQAFSPTPFPADRVKRVLQRLITLPGYRREWVRSAYCNGQLVGGYRIYERKLRVGEALLTTGCIGGVYTRAEFRNQGVATALMNDAIEYAQSHNYPLLLLDGIPRFYHRYGYCDVFDLSVFQLDYGAILAQPASPYKVREATQNDAPELLKLYDKQFGQYTGSFKRSIEEQAHWIEHMYSAKPVLAVDATNQVRGYLCLTGTQAEGKFFMAGAEVWELAVDDWDAAIALLQYHAKNVESQHYSEHVLYALPPKSPLAQWLTDKLEVVDISTWDGPVFGWSVRQQTFQHRNAGWMARLVSLPALTQAMLPEWQRRWQRSLARWSGDITLVIGTETVTLRIDDADVQPVKTTAPTTHTFMLTPQAFIQAIFGYRSITRLLEQQGYPLANYLASVLSILFPTGQTWIPASDWF